MIFIFSLAKGRLNVPTALCRDAVGPALGRQSGAAGITPCPDYKTPISGDCFDLTVQDVGICGIKCCILLP